MATNIINQNLQNLQDPEYGIPSINNQMAFRPNSMKDRQIKQLDVMPDMDQQSYDNLRKEDVEQFNEKGIPLSLPNDRYKGIEGYKSSIGSGLENFFFPSAGAAEINPNNTFTSSVANSPYEMDYIPPDRYRDFKPRVGTPQTMEQASMLQKGKDFFNQGKDLASSGILKAGKTGMNLFNLVKNNNPLGFLTSGIGNLFGGLDQFDTLSPADQQFILSQQDSVGNNKDPFGINIRSGFGNYADYVRNKGRFAKGNRGDYYKSLIPGLELAEAETRQREIDKQIAEQKALDAALARARAESARMGYQDYGSGAASQSTQDSYQGADGNYAGASTQDYDTPD
jgi:hypothetical protein